MALNVDYVLKETGNNLKRNVTLTLATVVTIAVTLALVGCALLIRGGVANANSRWRDNVEFIVYMNVDATDDQIAAVQTALDEHPSVERSTYLDKPAAYAEFVELFPDSPELVAAVGPGDLPTNFKVVPTDASEQLVLALSSEFEDDPGVRDVVSAAETVRQMEDFFGVISWMVVLGGAFLGLAALVLITNTIRMAMFARRREIEVMKLVGATNWFIRVPFMGEGLVQGLTGAALGVGGLWGVRWLIDSRLSKSFGFLQDFVTESGDVIRIGTLIVVAGAVVGLIGSAFAVSRFLDV